MEITIAIIVLAAAATVNFMSFVTLKKQIEAARLEIVNLIEISSNKIVKEVQDGNHFGEKAIGHLSCNMNELGAGLKEKIDDSSKAINDNTAKQVARVIYLAPVLKVK